KAGFDIAVIGAGPAAIAALDALEGKRVAIVTGAVPSVPLSAELHAKIQTVAMDQGEVAGVAERLPRSDGRMKPLFSTAAVGGLANYWGQQVLRYEVDDCWPRELFRDYSDYMDECDAIERLFAVEGGEALGACFSRAEYRTTVPRLLTGS